MPKVTDPANGPGVRSYPRLCSSLAGEQHDRGPEKGLSGAAWEIKALGLLLPQVMAKLQSPPAEPDDAVTASP